MNKRAHGQSINSSGTKLLSLKLSKAILRRRSGFDFMNAVYHDLCRAIENEDHKTSYARNVIARLVHRRANKDFVMREQMGQGRSKSNDRGSKKTK